VPARVAVCFTPTEDCESEIVAAIDAATKDIKVQAYGFSSDPILKSLRRAIKRGVLVELVLYKTDGFGKRKVAKLYSNAGLMAAAGAKVWIDDHSGIAHNKVIIIDGQLVVGGSFNYTKSAATKNRENVTFMQGPEVTAAYVDNWNSRRAISVYFNDLLIAARAKALTN
jgi:phosphatidylserine/phosphatidylglycerophosphate/cardiolipin synthase-like enzyme